MVKWEIYTLAISPTNPPDFGANSMLKNVQLWLESPNCFLLKLARVTNLIPLWKWLANERFPKRTQSQWATKSQHMQISWSLTGKSFSEALILASTNPQYGKRLFIELRVQYIKTTSSEHVVYTNWFLFWHSEQFMYTTSSELAIFMYWTCNSMNNLLSYCGLVDARISASEKDLPVKEGWKFCRWV